MPEANSQQGKRVKKPFPLPFQAWAINSKHLKL
ncbi:hypothetical protein EPYR_02952 [Erwinia pyrifoliae DSM 12163]|nr:hypothetical protein EPYR_02952 [Erwinia pyrifoliae DSM 12163]